MKRSHSRLSALAATLLAGAVLAACSSAASTTDPASTGAETTLAAETIRLGVMVDSPTAYAAAYGNAQGLFEKYNLTVDVTTFSMGIETIDAVSLGQRDIGGGADFAVVNRFGGAATTPLRLFAVETTSKTNAWQFWATDPAIQSPADLKGKRVLVQLGTVVEYWVNQTLAEYGLTADDVELLPIEAPMEAVALLQNGSADAGIANRVAGAEIEKLDGAHVIANLNDIFVPTLSLAISTDDYLNQHQGAVENYLKAQREAFEQFVADPEGSAQIIADALKAPVDPILINLKNTNYYLNLTADEIEAMTAIYDWGREAGKIAFAYDLRDYINDTALTAVTPDQVSY